MSWLTDVITNLWPELLHQTWFIVIICFEEVVVEAQQSVEMSHPDLREFTICQEGAERSCVYVHYSHLPHNIFSVNCWLGGKNSASKSWWNSNTWKLTPKMAIFHKGGIVVRILHHVHQVHDVCIFVPMNVGKGQHGFIRHMILNSLMHFAWW